MSKNGESEKKIVLYIYQKIEKDKYKYLGLGDSNFVSMQLKNGQFLILI